VIQLPTAPSPAAPQLAVLSEDKFGPNWLFGHWEADCSDMTAEIFFQRDRLYDWDFKAKFQPGKIGTSGTWSLKDRFLVTKVTYSTDPAVSANTTHAYDILYPTADGFVLRNVSTDGRLVFKRKY
jgi:hypothetical protein